MGKVEYGEGLIESILYAYHTEKKTVPVIAKELDWPIHKIWDFLSVSGLVRVPTNTKLTQDKKEAIVKLYVDLQMSGREIAKLMECSLPLVQKVINNSGVEIRTSKQTKNRSIKATQEQIDSIMQGCLNNTVMIPSPDYIIHPNDPLYNIVFSSKSMKALCGYHYGEDVKSIVRCKNCEGEFEIYTYRIRPDGNFCKPECHHEWMSKFQVGELNPHWQGKMRKVNCAFCGNELERPDWQMNRYQIFFCDNDCSGAYKSEHQTGENNPNWCGGTSFGEYCSKWTEELRERVRIFFGRKCVLCGMSEEENGVKLSVHHVDYDKTQCCNGKKPYLVSLCQGCHNKTSGKYVREKYEEELKTIVDNQYGGKCYLTKEEYSEYNKIRKPYH